MKKIPLVQIGIALGAGVGTYLAASQLTQRVASLQAHPVATPLALAGVGALIATKHLPIGLGVAGAAGAIGWLNYKASQPAAAGAQATQTQTQTQPAPATQPQAQPQASQPTASNDASQQAIQGIQQGLQQLLGGQGGTGTDTTGGGVTPAADGSTPGATGTSGYSAGALLGRGRPRPHAGALLGARGAVHAGAMPWHRNPAAYGAPMPGEAGSFEHRGGAYGLTSD